MTLINYVANLAGSSDPFWDAGQILVNGGNTYDPPNPGENFNFKPNGIFVPPNIYTYPSDSYGYLMTSTVGDPGGAPGTGYTLIPIREGGTIYEDYILEKDRGSSVRLIKDV